MARINKTEEEIINGEPEPPREETYRETLRERLEAIKLEEGSEPYSRIYRIDKKVKNGRVFIGCEYDFVFEEYVADNYGPGSYFIAYNWKEEGRTERSTSTFTIGDEYGCEPGDSGTPNSSNISGILANLTEDKIKFGVSLLKVVREVLAPPQPQIDIPALITAINSSKKSLSDEIVIAAMESLKAQNNKNSISQQIQDLKALKELTGESSNILGGEEDEEEGADHNMDIIIKTGMSLLQGLLQKNNDNYQAAGEEARKNATVNALLLENKDLAQKFFDAAAKKYGDPAAMQLAEGFGVKVQRPEAVPIPHEVNGGD